MKKITLLILALCLSFLTSAQVSIGAGNDGNGSNSPPLNAFWGFNYTQSIYLASEINASGNITSLDFALNPGSDFSSADDNVFVWIGHTTKTAFDNTDDWVDVSTLTQVLSDATVTISNDVLTLTFNSPFAYNGTDNLIIAVHGSESGFSNSGSYVLSTDGPNADMTLRYRNDSTDADPTMPPTGILDLNRGNITINGITQSCPAPTNAMVDVTSNTTATITWTAGGSETDWNYEYGETGFTQGMGTTGSVSAATLDLMNLTSGTTYDIYIQADCGGGSTSSFITVTWQSLAPPANDEIGGAIPITPSPEGTGCGTAQFTLNFSTDATTDSGLDGSCNTTDTGLDQFFTWTATSDGLLWNDASPGNPGIVVRDAMGNEIDCAQTFAGDDAILSGWNIGDDLIIQIYDFGTSISDVAFCLEEYTLPTPPANDDPSGALPLTVGGVGSACGGPDTITGISNAGSTDSGVTAPSCGSYGTPTSPGDLWYTVVAPAGGSIIFNVDNLSGLTSVAGALYSGTVGSLVEESCTEFASGWPWLVEGLTPGETYYVRVWDFSNDQTGTFDLCAGTPAPPPSNDDCANAWTIGVLPHNETGDASSATNNGGFISECASGMNDGVWFTFSVAESGTIDITVSGVTGWDPEVAIYSGSCGAFVCVDSADGAGTSGTESLTGVAVTAGTTYYINIGHFSGTTDNSEGPYVLDVTTSDTTTLSTEDNTLEGFRLFPTIVQDELKFDALENVNQVSIYNLLGQQVLRAAPNVSNSSIDVASLKAGIYLVRVQIGDSTGTYKIIKE